MTKTQIFFAFLAAVIGVSAMVPMSWGGFIVVAAVFYGGIYFIGSMTDNHIEGE